MIMEQYLQETVPPNNVTKDDEHSLNNWKSLSEPVQESENQLSSNFDCNICLETVQDPIVTLCGHLYCWPCIYKWINQQNLHSLCPVCKTEISLNTIVPLYVPGPAQKTTSLDLGLAVPHRPISPSCGARSMPRHQLDYRVYRRELAPNGINPTSPTTGMFGEMVYETFFGNLETSLFDYPDSYSLVGISTRRGRRQAMQADKSLSRICFFLFCCVVLCLFLF